MASESDMRRHTFFNPLPISKQASPPPLRPETAIPESDDGSYSQPLTHFPSNVSVSAAKPGDVNPGDRDVLSLDAIVPSFPAPPITPPVDINHHGDATRGGMSMDSDLSRPESPPIQEQTFKHNRFSLLRFRNASDPQLAARARQQALAEDVPPMPRRMC